MLPLTPGARFSTSCISGEWSTIEKFGGPLAALDTPIWSDRRRRVERAEEVRSHRRFDADPVVYGGTNALLGAQITFSSLDRQMPEQKLDLLKFATCTLAQAGARATKVMRCKLGYAGSSRGASRRNA